MYDVYYKFKLCMKVQGLDFSLKKNKFLNVVYM